MNQDGEWRGDAPEVPRRRPPTFAVRAHPATSEPIVDDTPLDHTAGSRDGRANSRTHSLLTL